MINNSVDNNEIYWFVYHTLWGLVYFVSFGEKEDIILHYANKNLSNLLDLKNIRDYSFQEFLDDKNMNDSKAK